MKAATITELKKELQHLDQHEIVQICLRITKYKKDNKELLTYLLFESENEDAFIEQIKMELESQFQNLNYSNIYYTKKGLRKVLRYLDKFIRYSGIKETEVQLRLFYIDLIKKHKIPVTRSKVLTNLYNRQLEKIKRAVSMLHEDLQYDYKNLLDEIAFENL